MTSILDPDTWRAERRFVDTPSGRIAYVERGRGPAALFVHGVLPRRIDVEGGRLFFPEERFREFNAALRAHWDTV
jgi:hypothetical protein